MYSELSVTSAGPFLLLWALLALYAGGRDPLVVVAFLVVISLLATFVPTPGGSGFFEAAVGLTTGGPNGVAPLVLWRIATFHLYYLLGPLAAWWTFRSRSSRRRRDRGADRTGDGTAGP